VSFWFSRTRTAPGRGPGHPGAASAGAIHVMVMRAERRSPSAPGTHKPFAARRGGVLSRPGQPSGRRWELTRWP
jgi:hypothetical protein